MLGVEVAAMGTVSIAGFQDLSLDYLAKAKILVIKDVERDDIEFLAKTLGCSPVASLDHFTADKLGRAELVQDEMVWFSSRRDCDATK